MTHSASDGASLHAPRRLFHMVFASVFPVMALLLPYAWLLIILLATAALVVLVDLARLRVNRLNAIFLRFFRPVVRPREETRVTGASYVLLGTLGAFVLYPRDAAVLAVLFTSLGDPVAGMVGQRAPGWRILGKSPWGTAAMVATGLAVAGLMHFTGVIGFRWQIAAGALVAGIVELLSLPPDDNVWVPLAAGGFITLSGL